MKRYSWAVILFLLCVAWAAASAEEAQVVFFQSFDEGVQVGEKPLNVGSLAAWAVVEYPEGSGNYCLQATVSHQNLHLVFDQPVQIKPGREVVVTLKYCATGQFNNQYIEGNFWLMSSQYGYGVRHRLLNPNGVGARFTKINGAWHSYETITDWVMTPGRDWGQWGSLQLVWAYDTLEVYVDGYLCDSITVDSYLDETIDRFVIWNYWRAQDTVDGIYYDDVKVEVIDRL